MANIFTDLKRIMEEGRYWREYFYWQDTITLLILLFGYYSLLEIGIRFPDSIIDQFKENVMIRKILLSLVAFLSFLLPAQAQTVKNVNLDASTWKSYNTQNFFNVPDGGMAFNFQRNWIHYVDYVYHRSPVKKMRGEIVVKFRVVTNGNAVFKFDTEVPGTNQGTEPANVRLLIWSYGGDWWKEHARWWSNPAHFTLQDGKGELRVPISPESWSSVFGKFGTDAPKQWQQAMNNVSYVGLTYGGGWFFAHGVYISPAAPIGFARFVIESYQIFLPA